MATLHLLGTGSANTSSDRTTTMLAVQDSGSTILIDCGGDVLHRVLASGLTADSIEGMIVTHEHPDHVSGFPLFMEKLWLAKRDRPIPVYGIRPAIDQARRCWEVFDTSGWSGVPEIVWTEVRYEENAEVLSDSAWDITASPGVHGVRVAGLRIRCKRTGGVLVYSSDTEPCDAITRLARDCTLLVHEANGEGKGHTSVLQAAEIARSAGARELILVHLPALVPFEHVRTARGIFPATDKGSDLARHSF